MKNADMMIAAGDRSARSIRRPRLRWQIVHDMVVAAHECQADDAALLNRAPLMYQVAGAGNARRVGGTDMKFATRRLGKTKVQVSLLGLGTASLGGNMTAVTEGTARSIVDDAYEAGIRYFDTAPFYGYGKSEHMVGDGLRERTGWTLSTKVGRLLRPRLGPQAKTDQWRQPHPFQDVFEFSYDSIMRAYEDSLQRLGLNHVDVLYIHDIDVGLAKEKNPKASYRKWVKSAYKALDELRRNGDIKAIGFGTNIAETIANALDLGQWDAFLLAGRYTLLEQAPLATLFPAVKKHGASIVVGGPFNSGILAGGGTFNYAKAPAAVVARVKKIAAVCDAHNVPLPAAALQFPIANPLVSSVIPGPRAREELQQILAWWETKIPSSLWSDLKSEGVLDESAPTPK
jgi:D-threo-aldose 1-dehydrogenase